MTVEEFDVDNKLPTQGFNKPGALALGKTLFASAEAGVLSQPTMHACCCNDNRDCLQQYHKP